MNRAEREALRESLAGWKAKMTVEMNVGRLRALLDACDALEQERDELLLESLEEDA